MRRSDSTIPELDLRAVRDALILRWWIIPLVMLISAGFLIANESDLQTSPGHVQVVRIYEARDESAVLTVAGIDPASIVPYPSFDNQLLVLQSPESRQKIANSINSDTSVSVIRLEKTFSLVDTVEAEGNKRFTFLSVGTPSYTFECAASTIDECNIAIDAYVEEISRLRSQSIQEGFERAEKLMDALTSGTQSADQSLVARRQALATGKTLVTGEMALVRSISANIGPTIGKVKESTYGFGLGIGAILGLLIVLQLSVIDKRIRTRRKLASIVGENHTLGTIRLDLQDSSIQYVAAALIHQLVSHGATTARLIPIGKGNTASSISALGQALRENSVAVTTINGVDHLTATELLSPSHSVVVFLVDSKTSRSDDLERVWSIVEHAGNTIVGVILVQH